jgi:Tol biopolymer transport system component
MSIKYLLILFSLISLNSIKAQEPIGIFKNRMDLGNSKNKGPFKYIEQSQSYILKSSDPNTQFSDSEYLYNEITGDFILTANFQLTNKELEPDIKVGWMIRNSIKENSDALSASLNGNGSICLECGGFKDDFKENDKEPKLNSKKKYEILQLERKEKELIFRAAGFGESLQIIATQNMEDLPDTVLAGIFITSTNSDPELKAEIWNVRIDQPVANDYNPNQEGFLGCRLEILDPFNGKRKVIYEKPDRFEAPNWMPDGEKLLFNMDGSLYKIPITGGKLEKLNTGFADQNNNDHGISFDGKLLAISHHREGLPGGGSTVYTLPIEGGEPKLVTADTPSYWHGWAPNNKEVVYVAQRKGGNTYNIYKASIKNGKETQLTNFISGHVDGPEYSPDGKYIYYNSTESGIMQLWRMNPNGSDREQITFDEGNDWFPHISPDGKWILYLSFPSDIPVNSHPSYKQVLLRMMPVNGGESKVVAYLYGGQGTINVPSWSPDSKYVAFVSNSGKF